MTVTAHVIVLANEKGGTGKSTTAVHIGVALALTGQRTALIDLDHRQRTSTRYLENRWHHAQRPMALMIDVIFHLSCRMGQSCGSTSRKCPRRRRWYAVHRVR